MRHYDVTVKLVKKTQQITNDLDSFKEESGWNLGRRLSFSEFPKNSQEGKMKKEITEIADYFGYEQQKNMLIEEQAELIQALNKFNRKGTEESFNNIIEEMADVELMIDQVRYLLDISKDAIEEIKAEKVKRTRSIIDQALKASTEDRI